MYLSQIRSVLSDACLLGSGGHSKEFYTGRLLPKVWPRRGSDPLAFYIPFLRKKVPLSYTFYWQNNGSCFTCLVKNFSSLLIAVNAVSLKPCRFFRHSHSHKMNQLALLGFFTDQNDRFLIYFNKWNSYPSRYLNPEIGSPFGRSLPV